MSEYVVLVEADLRSSNLNYPIRRSQAMPQAEAQALFDRVIRGEEPDLRVTAVHPGRIDTAMQRRIVATEGRDYDPDQFLRPGTVAAAVGNAVRTAADAHPTEIMLRPVAR